ncbi:ABC transporter substrate-binding protein [Myxococcus sp. XM-1-1-1]|uniref:ABC transporter substrate-binding protein n=1 Tax=Myxococcus sp. XM-1-1-1 TaxID=2874602 RepID=UPI001CBDE1B8|nr:ABC transporter substrate-binding protein [Myxococcus sp. XM-1-1-1]MBZ4407897.1 ABC transporter substrate-binding protein [Myxococcus sp. XM-1-1-1]
MKTLRLMSCCAALLAGCSFTTAGGLDECETSADCDTNQVCSSGGFCLPQPEGCGEIVGPTTGNPIILGAALPLTTSTGEDVSERQALNALKLAMEEINQREGVGGRRFNLLICDTRSEPARAREQAEWLVTERGVPAIFSSGSAQTIAISTITIPRNVLLMTHTATSPDIATLSDKTAASGEAGLVWRTAPSDRLQGRIIADLVSNVRAVSGDQRPFADTTTVSLVYVNDAYGQGLFDTVLGRVSNGRTPSSAFYARNGDVSAAVTHLATNPAPSIAVMMGFSEDNAKIITQAAAQGRTTQRYFFTDASKDSNLITSLGTSKGIVEGAYGTAPAQARPGDAVYTTFKERFRTAYNGTDPGQFSFTAHAYDSMYLVALGAAYAAGAEVNNPQPITGDRIAQGLAKVTPPPATPATTYALGFSRFTEARGEISAGKFINVQGASGPLDFDATGEAPSEYELFQIVDGAFQTVELIAPAAD